MKYLLTLFAVILSIPCANAHGIEHRSWTEYDFTGRPLRVRSEHRTAAMGADSAVVRTERRTYDRFGRELTLSHRYGEGADAREVTVRTNTYDAVGRLLTESLGDAAERTYEYDVRSRPVAITAYNYRQKLGFTYGGNVSRMTWWAYGPYETERSYTYSYDGLSRLTEARYSDGEGGTGRYDVTYSYDLNGNVTALQRSGLYDSSRYGKQYGLIDDLTLEYDGNMLRRVTDGCGGPYYQGAYHFVDGADGAQEYAYDGNGNTTMDLNRRVTAAGYDTNNRPRLIEFEGGSSTAYLYDAAGVKRRTVHRIATERPSVPGAEPQEPELSVTRTDYCGDIIYEDSLLSRINFDGGYLSFTDNAGERLDRPAYHFYHRDHLGNNRMDIGENGAVWQICHYYPYGMLMGCSYLGESQRWKFGGKELDRVSGLDLLDFEARPYDASLGRFWRPDDLADKYHPLSPYLYCAANPLRLIDPTGRYTLEGIKDGTSYTFISIHSSEAADEKGNSALRKGYEAAVENNVPRILVDDMADLAKAMNDLSEKKTSANVYAISGHGNSGFTTIGNEQVDAQTDFTPLKNGFQGSTLILFSCESAKFSEGTRFVQKMSNDMNCNVIGSTEKLGASNLFNGKSDFGLNTNNKVTKKAKDNKLIRLRLGIMKVARPQKGVSEITNIKLDLKSGLKYYRFTTPLRKYF